MIHFVGGERNFWSAQSIKKMQQKFRDIASLSCSRINSCSEEQMCFIFLLPRCYTKTKLKKYRKRRPVSGLRPVRVLRDNAPSHTSELLKLFLKSAWRLPSLHSHYTLQIQPQSSVSAYKIYLYQRIVM